MSLEGPAVKYLNKSVKSGTEGMIGATTRRKVPALLCGKASVQVSVVIPMRADAFSSSSANRNQFLCDPFRCC